MFGNKVAIDKSLYAKIEKVAEAKGYSSPKEFIVDTLEKAVTEVQEAASEEEVKKRLKGLDYL